MRKTRESRKPHPSDDSEPDPSMSSVPHPSSDDEQPFHETVQPSTEIEMKPATLYGFPDQGATSALLFHDVVQRVTKDLPHIVTKEQLPAFVDTLMRNTQKGQVTLLLCKGITYAQLSPVDQYYATVIRDEVLAYVDEQILSLCTPTIPMTFYEFQDFLLKLSPCVTQIKPTERSFADFVLSRRPDESAAAYAVRKTRQFHTLMRPLHETSMIELTDRF